MSKNLSHFHAANTTAGEPVLESDQDPEFGPACDHAPLSMTAPLNIFDSREAFEMVRDKRGDWIKDQR